MTKKLIIISLLILTTCSGCFSKYVHVYDRYPVYEMPPKAKIEIVKKTELDALSDETKSKITNTVYELKLEAAQLRAILESYNTYAIDKNKQYQKIK
jgi:hypothetical protein